ncbi:MULTISPECIES: hypothetical protein [Methylobacterium]|jgi:hypothetical protein|uniref:Uncharacterized protein n=1 Tax=Methylobacterium gossipiicola TaxID=582675 RepID=A0A1I2V1R8_9HYPH|nr:MULTISPECIES: hypothetical protein [Methylobacterium]SFG81146.1 hypothetical protein SAMN05192565_11228 [Methylobacterium gossipiicola]
MAMDKVVLAEAARLLLGPEWKRPLAKLLGPHHPAGPRDSLDPRLAFRWASGERPVPDWVPGVLADMLIHRAELLVHQSEQALALSARLMKEERDALG